MYFSPSARGFYAVEVHGENMPSDAIAITDELYNELSGPILVGEDGFPTPWTPPVPTVDERRAALKMKAANKRWQVEQGGITLPDGTEVETAIADQNRITSVLQNAPPAGIEAVDFKAASGWVSLTIEQLQDISNAISQHVQECFSVERAHCEAIDVLSDSDLETYDVNTGWPA
jgi:hypothetical protein